MVDRDPVTEPAGDMTAARKLIDVLAWIDEGGQDRFNQLCAVLLGWKGKRLRDAIADNGVVHLGKRQTSLTPDAPPERLARMVQAAGMVLSAPALESFLRDWLNIAPGNEAFLNARLTALGQLTPLLMRRKERELQSVCLLLLQCRAALPPDIMDGPTRTRIDTDALLAEHLLLQLSRHDKAILQERLSQWRERANSPDVAIRNTAADLFTPKP